MRNLAALVVFLGAVPICLAEQANCPPTASPHEAAKESGSARSAKIEHLLKAAEHLEAAGMKDDAQRIRRQADHERAAAAAEIEALRAEVEQLRALTNTPQPVLLHLRVFQLSRTTLMGLGLRFWKEPRHAPRSVVDALGEYTDGRIVSAHDRFGSATACVALDPDDRFFAALESLAKKGLVKLLSDPTIVAVSGRRASFHSGGEIPVPEQQSNGTISISWKKYGTQLNFVPIALPHQMIRLEFHAISSEIDPTLSFAISGTTVPALRSQEVETNAVVRSGQTLVVGDLVQTRITTRPSAASADRATEKSGQPHDEEEIREEIETVFLLTPELVSAPGGAAVKPKR